MWLPVQVAVVILLGTVASQSYPDVCSSSPCLNGGSCLSSNGNIYCFCPQAVYGDRCQMSFCKELKKAAMGRDICSLYKPNATCVGDILSGQFCQCPLGFTGLFCHERTYIEGDPTTPCDRQKQLYDFALKILNTSYTSDRIVNLLRMNFDLKAALRHIPIIKLPVRKCTGNGAFAPIQCQVDIDNISQKTCFCAETNGDIRDGYQESTTEPTGCPDENTKAGLCPNASSVAICWEECRNDIQCDGDKKCCSNGCGHVCMKPQKAHATAVITGLVVRLNMQWKIDYSISSSYLHTSLVKNLTAALNHKFSALDDFTTVANIEIRQGSVLVWFEAQFDSELSTETKMKVMQTVSKMKASGLTVGGVHYSSADIVVKNGTCPNMQGMVGDCQQRCQTDSNCTGDMKCCSNSCGHVCMHPVVKHDPCKNVTCPSGTSCQVQQVQCVVPPCHPEALCVATPCTSHSDCLNGGSCSDGKCFCFGPYSGSRCQYESVVKNGSCPNVTGIVGTCVSRCQTDNNCTGNMKCCSNGCGHVCMQPVVKHDPCKNVTCPSGKTCRPQQIQCFRAPCYPVAQCVGTPCTTFPYEPYTDCQNGGSCANGKCFCFGPYYGDRCQLVVKNGTCPNMQGMVGDCRQRCQTDSNCTGDMKCCSNGCGHVCMHPVVKHDPCKNVTCPSGKTCRPQQVQCFRAPCYPVAQCVATPCTVFPYEPYSDCQNGGSCFSGKCECFGLYYGDRCQYEAVVKNGTCPNMQGMMGDCPQRCHTDSNCTGDMKCCSNGCGHVCMHPVVKRDPCKNVSCPFGTVCRPQQVECFTTPCYPIAQCVSEKGCNSSMDCMNGGSCDNGKCQCYKKYYGDRCEQALTDISVCESNLDCYNGGQCLQGRCACKASFYGYGCLLTSNFTAINCQETLCENGGSCYGSSCYCPDSFFGKTCQYSVREDVDTYRKFRSDLKINMPWRESFRELSDHQIMKTTLESQLRQVFASVPNFDRVEITSFRPGSVVAYYTAHFTDVIDQDSVLSTAKALDNITVNFFGINYSVLPHDDCRSSQHSCVNGGCKLSSNGTYECVCQPTFTGKSCDENVCSGFMCMYGFQCYVTHMGKPRCNCSYGFGEHCENVPCGCDPNSERCIKRDVCTNGECTPQETCVALNYTGPCMYSKCLYGECVETVDSGSYCKCMDNYKGAICDTKKSICDMLPVDVCAYYGSKCVGDIMDGRLCECPSGKRGAFCELDGYATTKCQRQSDLYQTAINILNGTYTVPLIPNAAQIVRTMLRGTFGSDFIPNMKCLENGDYAPMQCNVNIYSMNTTACYCMNSEGMQLTQRVPDPMGYPACTGPSVSPVAQALCGAAYSDAICLNGGSCVGDLMGSHPRLCHCREGFTGVVCQRRLESNEQPENFTKCTLGSDIYRLMDDIVHGKFKFVITVSGINITITPDMILNLFRMSGGGTLTNYATTEPTTMPTTTPYWEDLDGGFTTATTTVDEGHFMNTNDEDYFTNTPSTTVPPQTWETGDWYTTQTVPTVTSDSDYFTNTPSTTVPPQTWETGDWYTTQTVPTVTSDSDFSTTTSYPETFATTPSYSSNSTSDAHTFLSRYECTHDGKFKPLQCEYNLLTKERGACRCVYQNGSIVPGSRSWSPGNHHCKSVMPDECPKMKCFITCEHGFLQDLKGCDICMCRKPCHGKMCGMGQRCVNETSYDRMRCNERYSCQVPVCRKMHKRGVCPAGAVATMESLKKMFLDSYHTCDIQCHDDADCEGNMKCCGACGNKCVKPFDPETCFEKKAIMDVHWALYQNMSTYLSDDTNIEMANSTYPQVLKGAMSWLRHMQVMWLPNCTRAGDYERVQCEYSVKTNDTVNCFCVNDDGLRVDRTDVMPPNTPDCSDKPGMCPQVSADVFGTCPQECENDFGCTGSQKCCSNGCGHICMKPVNFTGPSKAMNMNAMLAKLCKGKDLCKYGYCAADWKKGDLCRCSPGWTGVTCDKRRTGEKPSPCKKRKALFNWIKAKSKKVKMAMGHKPKDHMLSMMFANCTEDREHFQPMQCDRDVETGRVKWCYCVDEEGLPINGTEVDHPARPQCGAMSCPSGNPMMKMKMESDLHKPGHFKCNSERGCPDGYKCMGMAYGKKLCCPSEHGMKDICSMTYNSGKQCDDESASPQQTRFYYNHRDGRCHDFTYRGCSGNENNFVSKEACEKRCHRKEKPGKCMKVKANTGKKGHCPSSCMSDADCEGDKKCCMTSCGMKCSLPYNDTVSAVCKNGFPLHKKDGDVLMCSRARQCPDGYTCHVPPADGGGYCCPEEDKPIDICHQPSDGGPCKATMRRYFFNSQTQQCEQFIYGGCRGNENNFFSLEECCNSCGGNATRCKSGVCPRPKNYLTTCARQCEVDADCHGKQICCYNGCGRKCTAPALSSNTTYNCYEYLEMAYYMMNIKTESCNIVTLPRCNRDGSWKRQQCTDTLGVCWCVDKTGTVIPGSKTRGVANCEETPDFYSPTQNMKTPEFKVCSGGESVHCCNASLCHMKTCPANPSAVCRINPCGGCSVEFRDHNNNVIDCDEGLSKCQKHHHTAMMYRKQHAVNKMIPMPMMGSSSHSKPSSPPVKVKLPDVCFLPPFTGMCEAYIPSWFYNDASMKCEKFIYGGCDTNGNKFPTADACYKTCNQKASPCKKVKCADGEKCRLSEEDNCEGGPCEHWASCDALFSELHIGGVYLPVCRREKYALRQCHHGYCWCVSQDGVPVPDSLTNGHSLICQEDGTFQFEADAEVGRCADGKAPRLHCLDACMTKVCPGHEQATCLVNMCDDQCGIEFVQNDTKVSCTEDPCALLSAKPNDDCPVKTVCPSGQAPPMCDPRSCSNMTCPSNPCAVCTIDPCSCRVTFVDLLTKETVNDCDVVSHTLCEIEMCQKFSDKARDRLMNGDSDIPMPTCTNGLFDPKQCIGEYCWCVDGFGRKTMEVEEDEICVRNETLSVTVWIKFNQPFSRIRGREAEFERALVEALNKLSIDSLLESVEFREGSIDAIMTFKDKNEMSLQLAVVPDIITRKIRNNELALQWDGEDWLADKDEIVVEATFEAFITEQPEEPEEPEKKGPSLVVIIILVVVCCVVGCLVLIALVFCFCRRKQSSFSTQSSNDHLYESNLKQPPSLAATNAMYGLPPKLDINYMPYVVEDDSKFIKEKL